MKRMEQQIAMLAGFLRGRNKCLTSVDCEVLSEVIVKDIEAFMDRLLDLGIIAGYKLPSCQHELICSKCGRGVIYGIQ